MKKLCLVMCIFLIVPAIAGSQEPYREGDWALGFSIGGLYLNGFDGGVGGKWWRHHNTALVGNINLSYHDSLDDLGGGETRGRTRIITGFGIGLEHHFGVSRFSPYVGSILGYNYGYSAEERGSQANTGRAKTIEHAISLSGTGGVEFWLTSRFSLAGEYRLTVKYIDTT